MFTNSLNTEKPSTLLSFGKEEAQLIFFEGTEANVTVDFKADTSKIGGIKLFGFRQKIKDEIKKEFKKAFPLELDTIQDEEVGFKEIVSDLASEFEHVKFQTGVIDKSVIIEFDIGGTIFAKNKKGSRKKPFVDQFQLDRDNTEFNDSEKGSEEAFRKYFTDINTSSLKGPVGLFGKSGGVVSANKLAGQISEIVDVPLFVSVDYVDTPKYLDAINEMVAENALEKGLNNILKGKKIADLKGFDFSSQKDKAFDTSTDNPKERGEQIIAFFDAYSPQKKLASNIGKVINYYQEEEAFDPYSAFITNKLQGVQDVVDAENINVEEKYQSSVLSQLLTHGNIDNISVVQAAIKSNIDDYLFSELDFDPGGLLTFNGTAFNNRGNLELTPNSNSSVGGAFLSKPIPISKNSSFSSQFTFFLDKQGADGISFVVHNDSRGSNALGMAGNNLGYFGSDDLGIDNSLAVYFDTFKNSGDPSDNFIGIGTNGNNTLAEKSIPVNFSFSNIPFLGSVFGIDLNSNQLINAWVDYDGADDELSVFLSRTSRKPSKPLLKETIDLPDLVGDQALFGFTGATGGSSQTQSIYEWSINLPSSEEIILNFNEDASGNPLQAGDIITDQYSELGLTIIAAKERGNGNPGYIGNPMIFDSENPIGGDFDLETTNQGNVLIVSQDNDSSNPKDNNTQGIFRFDWDQPVSIEQIGLLDIDADESVRVITVDANNSRINEHNIKKGEGAGNNQLQDLIIGDEGVYGMVVQLSRSGAITNVLYAPDNSVNEGTSSLVSVETDTDNDILIGSTQNDSMSNLEPNTEQLVAGNDESLLIPELNSTLTAMDQGSIIPLETDITNDVMMSDDMSAAIPNTDNESMFDMSDIPGVDPENSHITVI